MNTFGQLVKITTGNKDLVLSNNHLEELNLEYFYDIKNSSIYIN